MNAPQPLPWSDANQRVMVAELARLKQRLGGEGDADDARCAVDAARAAMPAPAAIDRVCEAFGLSAFERDVLLLCAGVAMDAQLAARCALAVGDPQRRSPTFGLALAALDAPHWSALAPARPLRRWRLVELDETAGVTEGRLRIDERVLHYLAGVNYPDVRLRALMRPAAAATMMARAHRSACDNLVKALSRGGSDAPIVALNGDDVHAHVDVAAEVASALGLALYMMRAEDVPAASADGEALATLWEREAVLLDAALLVTCGREAIPRAAQRLIEDSHNLVFVSACEPLSLERPALRFTIDKPDDLEQKHLWQRALGTAAEKLDGALDGVATQFRLSARVIAREGAQLAGAVAASDTPARLLWSACRRLSRTSLDELAQRIGACAEWDDIVLPDAQKATLRQIAAHVENRLKVHVEWGFGAKGARGLGVTALFAGESGTGKTMAAEVLARELDLDLYRIDLSAVVSKYIGETEKNLRRVFDAAEETGAVLLFDEADALFGKRSEVRDSHDRYANIEVSYLLQRMESYRGLAILTTNLKPSLDVAFQRRLRFIVHFPFPDQAMREAIWRSAFPAGTPVGVLDYRKLARLNVTGGHIRNIAINGAFEAAAQGDALSMAHLLRAAHHEAAKRERPLADAETRGWT